MTVYKRPNSDVYQYKFKWTIKHADGTKESFDVRRSARTRNKGQAKEMEDEHKRAIRLGQVHPNDPWPKPIAPEAPSVRAFTKRFLEHAEQHNKPGTHVFYSTAVERLLKFDPLAKALVNEGAALGEVISRYIKHRKGEKDGNAVITINGELRTLRRMLNLAVEWGVSDRAPIIHELPGEKRREFVVSDEQESTYLSKASETCKDMTIIIVDTGLRPNSELFVLRWANIHFEKSDNAPNGFIHVERGKTHYATRNVPMTPRVREVLLYRWQNRKKMSEYVFPGTGGKRGHIVSIQHPHERAAEKAGIESFEYYCWRHTFATRAAQSGMDKHQLARLMGHSSPSVADKYYIHITDEHVGSGFQKFVSYREEQVKKMAVASNA